MQRLALDLCAFGAVLTILYLTVPVGLGVFLGILVAFTVQPAYQALGARTHRPRLSAGLLVCASMLSALGTAFGLVTLFASRGTVLAKQVAGSWDRLTPPAQIDKLLPGWLGRFGVSGETVLERIREAAGDLAGRAASVAEAVLATTTSGLLAFFFAILTAYFALLNGPYLASRSEMLLPLRPAYTRALFLEFRRVGRMTLLGTILTGAAQGAFAWLGYLLFGIPEPLFWGAATAIASLIPVIGTLIVWVPAGVVLLLTDHPARGILELLWGALIIVGLCDYVIRPTLVGRESEMPSVITFASLFGGVEVFGLKGLILGPVLMSLALSVLRIYARDQEDRRSHLTGS